MPSIQVECGSCQGTGLYRGFAEKPGTAVVCLSCNGSGERALEYKPFTGRKERPGVERVFLSRGTFLGTGVGQVANAKGITYEEFRQGKLPE